MRHIVKKVFAFTCALVMCFGATGCKADEGTSLYGKDNKAYNAVQVSISDVKSDVDIWTTYGSEKILRDAKTAGVSYDNVRLPNNEIYVVAAKGEYEGGQLILSSKIKLNNVELVAADLYSGNNKFNGETEILYEKYLELTSVYDSATNAVPGYYPDALVPMSAIVEAGENTVNAGDNQGIYVRFNVPTSQAAGEYTGTFSLKYNSTTVSIPVRLVILDVEVSQETHSRSLFISDWYYRLGELDSTQEMLEKYIKAGFEYRISPSKVVHELSLEDKYLDESIAYYVSVAKELMRNPKCSNIAIPFKGVSAQQDGVYVTSIDKNVLVKILKAFVDESIKDNFDYVAKIGCHLVDEPQQHEHDGTHGFEKTKAISAVFNEGKSDVAAYVRGLSFSCSNFTKEQLAQSVLNIVGAVSGRYEDKYSFVETWCPEVDVYNSADERAKYENCVERWWYTCITPRAPYPTYHIEDTLLSARALGWMQADYDVKGVLFWATNIYANYNGSNYEHIEDFYSGSASRYAAVNGDGFLFYPGLKYGIDGPLGSLRLEAIRDGLEEYELLYKLKQDYATASVDSDSLFELLTSDMYTGTAVGTTSPLFDTARTALYQLAVMNDKLGARITYNKTENDAVITKLFAPSDCTVYNGSTQVTDRVSSGNGYIYTVRTQLDKANNSIDIRIKKDGVTYEFTKGVGGKATLFTAQRVCNAFTQYTAGVNTQVSSGNAQITVNSVTGSKTVDRQSIKFTDSAIQGNQIKNIKMTINLSGSSNKALSISARLVGEKTFKQLVSITLKPGVNEINIPFATLSLGADKNLDYLKFEFGGKINVGTTAPAITFTVSDLVAYNK